MNLHGRATGRALLSDADYISTASNLLKSRLAHRKSREEIYKTISALRHQGLTWSEIGRRTGFPRRSVAKWLQFETPPDRKRAVLKRSSKWYLEEYLKQSWVNGIRSGNALFSMIQERGYEGSLSNLQRLLAGWRRAEKQELRQRRGQFQHIRLRPLGAGAHVAEKTLQDQLHNAASARQSGKAASIVARSPSSSVRQAAVASASASAAVGAEMDMLASVDAEGAPVPGSRM